MSQIELYSNRSDLRGSKDPFAFPILSIHRNDEESQSWQWLSIELFIGIPRLSTNCKQAIAAIGGVSRSGAKGRMRAVGRKAFPTAKKKLGGESWPRPELSCFSTRCYS